MALLGQALGQTSPGSELCASAHHLNARGYTKHRPQSSAKVPGARQRGILFRKWCVISLCPWAREGVIWRWQICGHSCRLQECWSNPRLSSSSIVPSKLSVVCLKRDHFKRYSSCPEPLDILTSAKDVGIFLEGHLLWDSAGTSWMNILLLD